MDAGHDRTAWPASSGVGRIEDYWHCLHRRSVEMGDFCPRRSHRSPGKIHHGQLSGVDHDRISLRSVYGAPDYSKFVRDTAARSLSIATYLVPRPTSARPFVPRRSISSSAGYYVKVSGYT